MNPQLNGRNMPRQMLRTLTVPRLYVFAPWTRWIALAARLLLPLRARWSHNASAFEHDSQQAWLDRTLASCSD
jgi:hypothetical protein